MKEMAFKGRIQKKLLSFWLALAMVITLLPEMGVTAYANDTYTVTFDANGHGTAPDAQPVVSGNTVTEPTAPTTDDNYYFDGWYKEAACTNSWNFSTDTVTENTILYAKWTEYDYSLITPYTTAIQLDDGIDADTAIEIAKGKNPEEDPYTLFGYLYLPESDKYRFARHNGIEWSSGVDEEWTLDGMIGDLTDADPDTFYVIGTVTNSYPIILDPNEGEVTAETLVTDIDISKSGSDALTSQEIAFEYSEDKNTYSNFFKNNSALTAIYWTYNGTKWDRKSEPDKTIDDKVHSTDDMNDLFDLDDSKTYITGDKITLTPVKAIGETVNSGNDLTTIPAREGYTFDGWYDKKTGGNKVTTITDAIFDGLTESTVYAHWTENDNGNRTWPNTNHPQLTSANEIINGKAGTKQNPKVLTIQEADGDTGLVDVSYIKGVAKKFTIKPDSASSNSIVTVNAGTKYYLDGKYSVVSVNAAGTSYSQAKDMKKYATLKYSSKLSSSLVSLKKGKKLGDQYNVILKKADGSDTVTLIVNNLSFAKTDTKRTYDSKTSVSVNVALKYISGKEQSADHRTSAITWKVGKNTVPMQESEPLKIGKSGKEFATVYIDDETGEAVVTTLGNGNKGTVSLKATVNGKKYSTKVKIK